MKKQFLIVFPLLLILLFPFIPLLKYDIFLSWSDWSYVGVARKEEFPNLFVYLLAFLKSLIPTPYDLRFLPPLLLFLVVLAFFIFLRKSESLPEECSYLSPLILPLMPGFLDAGLVLNPSTLALLLFACGILFSTSIYASTTLLLLLYFTDFKTFLLFSIYMALGIERRRYKTLPVILGFTVFLLLSLYRIYVDPSLVSAIILPGEKAVTTLGYVPLLLSLCGFIISKEMRMKIFLFVSFLLYAWFGLPASFVALPIAFFGGVFMEKALPKKRILSSVVIILIFWIALSASFFYMDRIRPASDDIHSFIFARNNTLQGNMMTGWFYASISSFIVGRMPVSVNEKGENVYEKQFYTNVDTSLLDRLDARYVYFGAHEAYDYPSFDASRTALNKIYAGKGSLYDLQEEKVYLLITIDSEQDLPPVLKTYRGIEEGIPKILSLLEAYNIKATFFVTGDVIEKYPDVTRKLSGRHEVGLHGMYHEKFTNLSDSEKESRVLLAMKTYEEVLGKKPLSFRAPGHSADTTLINILEKQGFIAEASGTELRDYSYHPSSLNWNVDGDMRILRVPISHAPQYFYASMLYGESWIDAYKNVISSQKGKTKVVVIGMHSWEFVPLEAPGYETYTRVCGDYTSNSLKELLEYLKSRNTRFITVSELVKIFPSFPSQDE